MRFFLTKQGAKGARGTARRVVILNLSVILDETLSLTSNGLRIEYQLPRGHDVVVMDPIDAEKKLVEYIKMELDSPYGHLAVASDMTRLLSSVLKRGIYSDFDWEMSNISSEVYETEKTCLLDINVIGNYNDFIATDNPFSEFFLQSTNTSNWCIETIYATR